MATKKQRGTVAKRKQAETTTARPKKEAAVTPEVDGPRRVRAPKRRFWRRQDKRFRARRKLPNVFKLTKFTTKLLLSNWKLVGGIVLVYGVLTIIFVRGLNGGTNVSELKQQLNTVFHGAFGRVAAGLSVFGLLVSSSNTASTNAAGAYQTLIILICSLALVWTFRQRLAGAKIRIRDGFYNGMYPLVPTILILMVIGLQLLPLVVGTWLYGVVTQPGVLVNGVQQAIAVLVLLVFVLVSIYWVCSSVFALYIVTLPNMTPLKALRSARELVRYRRWSIIRKVLYLPLVMLVLGMAIMLPCIWLIAPAAQWIFFVLGMFALAVIHAYMYTLYRELIRE